MFKIFAFIISSALLGLTTAVAQNTNSSAPNPVRPGTTIDTKPAPAPTQRPVDTQKPATTSGTTPKPSPQKPLVASSQAPGSAAVVAALSSLLEGIRHTDVDAVMNVYWNSPRLVLFNNNGTVTKGWDQVRKNRESSYPELKDVKLEVRDLSVTMLGRDGALVSCLWTQSQTYKGTPETAAGRMSLVFRRVGSAWKAIHLHTSPDAPNPASIPPSEQMPKPSPTPNQ
jgi:ketosteroid isomerase-like protein